MEREAPDTRIDVVFRKELHVSVRVVLDLPPQVHELVRELLVGATFAIPEGLPSGFPFPHQIQRLVDNATFRQDLRNRVIGDATLRDEGMARLPMPKRGFADPFAEAASAFREGSPLGRIGLPLDPILELHRLVLLLVVGLGERRLVQPSLELRTHRDVVRHVANAGQTARRLDENPLQSTPLRFAMLWMPTL